MSTGLRACLGGRRAIPSSHEANEGCSADQCAPAGAPTAGLLSLLAGWQWGAVRSARGTRTGWPALGGQ